MTTNTDTDTIVADALRKAINESVSDLVNANVDAIRTALLDAEENKLRVGVSVAFTLTGTKLHHVTRLSFSTKFSDEVEGIEDVDEDQTKMDL